MLAGVILHIGLACLIAFKWHSQNLPHRFEFPNPQVYLLAMEKTWEIKEQELREEIAQAIEALDINSSATTVDNGLGIRMRAANVARGIK